jgi:hypothetical protein
VSSGAVSNAYDITRNVERADHLDDPKQKAIYDAETYKARPGVSVATLISLAVDDDPVEVVGQAWQASQLHSIQNNKDPFCMRYNLTHGHWEVAQSAEVWYSSRHSEHSKQQHQALIATTL